MTIIKHCTSCDRGYRRDFPSCSWCGSDQHVERERGVYVVDTECYKDYWLCKFKSVDRKHVVEFEAFPGQVLDAIGLHRMLTQCRIVTFNGEHYDVPMIALALTGVDCARLKQASDAIITQNLQPWDFRRTFNIDEPLWIDHVDLIEIKPGQGSLKICGGKLGSKKIQDLPIEPGASIAPEDRPLMRSYCENDLDTTIDLYDMFKQQVKLRDDISEEYGVNVMCKSDPQIAEAVFKKLVGRRIEKHYVAPGTQFFYRPPSWLKFQNLKVLELLARSPFTVNDKGGAEETKELSNTNIILGGTKYKMGIGGLHSTEKSVVHLANDEYSVDDFDVSGYYPSLIIRTGIFPPAIGEMFKAIYRGWYEKRLGMKARMSAIKAEIKTLKKELTNLPNVSQ
jgi:hypothetical protein